MTREQLALILREAMEIQGFVSYSDDDAFTYVIVDGEFNFLTLADAVLAALPWHNPEPSPIPAKKPRYAVARHGLPSFFTTGKYYRLYEEGDNSDSGLVASWPRLFVIEDDEGDLLGIEPSHQWTFIP